MRVTAILLGGLVAGACSLSLDHSLIEDGGKGSGGVTGSDASDAKASDSPTESSSDSGTDVKIPDAPVSDTKDVSTEAAGCTISALGPACNDCGEQHCCSEWNDCAQDTQCIPLAACMAQNCQGDISQACADTKCASNASAFPLFQTLAQCFTQNCATECGDGGG